MTSLKVIAYLDLVLASFLLTAASAAAQDQEPSLVAAEEAWSTVDSEETRKIADALIQRGGLGVAETARAYQLRAIGETFAGDAESARASYIMALQADPTLEADRSLNPQMREPFNAAKGRLSAFSQRLNAELALAKDGRSVVLTMQDPLRSVDVVVVSLQREPSPSVWETKFAASQTRDLAEFGVLEDEIAEQPRFEFTVTLQDEFGNAIRVLGSEKQPLVFENPHYEGESSSAFESPWFWTVVGVVVAAGAGAAIVYGTRTQSHVGQVGVEFGL